MPDSPWKIIKEIPKENNMLSLTKFAYRSFKIESNTRILR